VKSGAVGTIVRLLVTTALTAFILWKIHPADALRAAGGADWRWIGAAVLLVLFDRALNAYRWLVLLRPLASASHVPLWPVMRIFFVSTFVGTFLPAGVGDAAVRAYSLSRLSVPGAAAVASVFMDRMLGVLSILLMAVAGLFFARDLATQPVVLVALAATLCGCVATALVVFSRSAADRAAALLRFLPGMRLERIGRALLDAVRSYSNSHRELANVLAGSLGVQVLRIVQAWFLGLSLGVTAPAGAYFAFIPLILLVMLVPVSIFGIGTSQIAFLLFARAGVPDALSVAMSVLFLALGVFGNLPGLFLYLTGSGAPHDAGSDVTA
jgi:glycosyltransferase 2 family protein